MLKLCSTYLRKTLLPFHLCISFIICLDISGCISIYFIDWIIIQHLFIMLLKLWQTWPLGTLCWILCSFEVVSFFSCYIFVWRFFFFFSIFCFLPLQDSPKLPCSFPAPILESSISWWSCGYFNWRLLFEFKIWLPGILIATGMPFFKVLTAIRARKYMLVY